MFSRNRDTIDGAGLGFIVSASLSWKTSDAKAAKKLAKKHVIALGSVCQCDLALVRGYIAFLDIPGSTIANGAAPSGNTLIMDEGVWRAAVISPAPLLGPPPDGTPWVLAYWRQGREEVPLRCLLDRSIITVRHLRQHTNAGGYHEFRKGSMLTQSPLRAGVRTMNRSRHGSVFDLSLQDGAGHRGARSSRSWLRVSRQVGCPEGSHRCVTSGRARPNRPGAAFHAQRLRSGG